MKRLKISLSLISTILLLICAINKTFSASISAVSNGNWNSPTTWSGGNIPTANDDVTISGYIVVISTAQSVKSITVETSSSTVGKLIVEPDGYLTAVTGTNTILIRGGEIENAGTINLYINATSNWPDCIKYENTSSGRLINSGKYSGTGTLIMHCATSENGSAVRMNQTNAACYFGVGGNFIVTMPIERPLFNIGGTSVINGNGTITVGTSETPANYNLFLFGTANGHLTVETNVTFNIFSNITSSDVAPIYFKNNISSAVSLTNKGTININGTATNAIISTNPSTVTINNQGNIKITGAFTQSAIGNASNNNNAALNINNAGSILIEELPNTTTALNCRLANGGVITFTNNATGNLVLNIANTSIATSARSRINNSGNIVSSGIYNGQFDILSGGTVTINAGNHMSFNGIFNNSGTLNLLSNNAKGTATIITPEHIGGTGATYNIQQYLSSTQKGVGGRNWYISSPLSAAATNIISTATDNGLVYYDGNNWVDAGPTMEIMKGYIAKSPAQNTTINFTGGALNTGSYSLENLASGFHLVGNPYPSFVDFEQVIKTNIANSIWYRSKKGGAYNFHTYNVTSGIRVNDGTAIIAPMQSFWIKATSASNVFEFTNAMRVQQDQNNVSNRLKAPKVNTNSILRLQVSNMEFSDETVIYANENTSNLVDDYDTQKMFNNINSVPELYTESGNTKLAINGIAISDFEKEIALGFSTGEAGTFEIKATEILNFNPNKTLYLIDKLENTELELRENASYTFESGKTAANANRFAIIFRNSAITTNTIKSDVDTQLFAYASPTKQIIINAPLHANFFIYNATGQIVENGKIKDLDTKSKPLDTGVYIVKTNNETKRVIVK